MEHTWATLNRNDANDTSQANVHRSVMASLVMATGRKWATASETVSDQEWAMASGCPVIQLVHEGAPALTLT